MSGSQRTDFYAHSTERADKVDWQCLADHLSAEGKLAAEKATILGGEGLAQVEGLLHDLGKRTEGLPKRLKK